MKRSILLAALALAGCGSCPPGVSENLANVEKIVSDNARIVAGPDESPVLAEARALRNREALSLAKKMAEACK